MPLKSWMLIDSAVKKGGGGITWSYRAVGHISVGPRMQHFKMANFSFKMASAGPMDAVASSLARILWMENLGIGSFPQPLPPDSPCFPVRPFLPLVQVTEIGSTAVGTSSYTVTLSLAVLESSSLGIYERFVIIPSLFIFNRNLHSQ